MTDDDKKKSEYFQVVEKSVLNDDGEVVTERELLREGEIVIQDGHRYRIVKNKMGTLYKQSLDPLGQVGSVKPISVHDYLDQTLEVIQSTFKDIEATQGRVNLLISRITAASATVFQPMMPQEIQDEYKDRFNDQLRSILHIRSKSTIFCYEEKVKDDWMLRVATPAYGCLRVTDPTRRQEAIDTLIAAVNDLAQRGLVKAIFLPLSTYRVDIQAQDQEVAQSLRKLLSPVIAQDELILFWPIVSCDPKEVMALYPKIFLPEGQDPEPFTSAT